MTEDRMNFPMYIGGEWSLGEGEESRDVVSPATGDRLGSMALGTPGDVDRAVRAAHAVAPDLREMTVFERADLCVRIADAISQQREELAHVLSLEHGKPLHREAIPEVDASQAAFQEAAEQIKWMTSPIVSSRDRNKLVLVFRRPRGVYGIITPWNFPLGVACIYYLAAGLAAGNAMVWVPAPSASAVASALMRCVEAADVPKGAINLVTGEGPVVGDALVAHPGTNAVGFTGSTVTGRQVASRAAGKPCLLEMGGNGPSIVLEDADLGATASAVASGSFVNAGQICTSTERVLAHEAIADELVERVSSIASEIRVGDPLEASTTMGPVHMESVAQKVLRHVAQARERGAVVVRGGRTVAEMPTPLYVEPTVVDHVPPDVELNSDETFGPVVPVIRFSRLEELPQLVATSPYGLSGAVFGADIRRAMRVAERLPCGIVNINAPSSYWEPQIPAGGAAGTGSGYGRSGGPWSIEEMSETQAIVVDIGDPSAILSEPGRPTESSLP